MKIAVLGTGGVGGYFGARLAMGGTDVVFVARGAQLEAMKKNGLKVLSPLGDATIKTVEAVGSIAEAGQVDLVMITVKLWDLEDVAKDLVPIVAKGAAVVSFQNGVSKDNVLKAHLPDKSVLGGVAYISSSIEEPGVIHQHSKLQGLTFGEYGGERTTRVTDLFDACTRAGIDAKISDDIERDLWEKFVFLVGISAANAAMRQPLGPIRTNPQTRAFLLDLMREVVDVGKARGVNLADDLAETKLAACDEMPAEMMASMYIDLQHGRRLELPWLSSAVAAYGRKAGVQTPRNQAVSDVLALFVEGAAS